VLKIIKHCQDEGQGGSEAVQGVLLGLVENNCLEVTNCFAFPRCLEEPDNDEVYYQMEIMRNLRQVNIDHLHVGWYQSTYFASFINRALLESQYNYQSSIEESIVLIYDPLKTGRGHMSLKAMRVTPAMMELYKEGDFSPESVKKAGLSFEEMFEEVPLVIKNSHLTNALCCELEEIAPTENPYDFLDLATSSVLEKDLKLLLEAVDDISQDSNKFFNYQRQLSRQQQAKQQFLAKRAQENQIRAQRGEEPLPEDDVNRMFKAPQPPPRLDSLLLSQQCKVYTDEITEFASQSFAKMFITDALQAPAEAEEK
jgi:translation initiation factor 3 subunit H